MKKQKAKKAVTSTKKDEAPEATTSESQAADADAPEPDTEDAALPEANADPSTSPPQAAPSLAEQSKLRSSSFRKSISISASPLSPGPFSPDGETAPDIYRKHVARIEELEKENKRLSKEAADSDKRWQKVEEELADLREADGDGKRGASDGQVEKLVRV
jgi:hypothetical protein